MLVVFVSYFFLRRKLYSRKMQERLHKLQILKVPLAPMLQPHIFFLTVLLGIYIYLMIRCSDILIKYKMLDASTFNLPASRKKEYQIPDWLRFMAVASPLAIGLTMLATFVHIYKHFPKRRGFDDHLRWYPSYSHDLSIQVALLPLVYGLFSLDSTYQMLQVMTGQQVGPRNYGEKENYFTQVYTTNFELADLCEAWALQSFGVLCFMRVSRQIRLEAPTVKYIINTVKAHLSNVQCNNSRDRTLMDDLMILNNPEELLFQPLQQTAGIGVAVFVYTYAVKSIYLLTLGLLAERPLFIQLCGDNGKFPAACSFAPYADGAAFLASTLAIYNLVVFERRLKDILKRENFKPFQKFLGVKALVSIAFFQKFVLQVVLQSFGHFTDFQSDLCYSCLISMEVLPMSLTMYFAWRPMEHDWYDGDRIPWLVGEGGEPMGQLANEKPNEGDEEAFLASRQLDGMVSSTRPLGSEVAATIELHGRVSAAEGKALEDLVNAFSKTMTAVYKPAAFFRNRGPGALRSSPSVERLATSASAQNLAKISSGASSQNLALTASETSSKNLTQALVTQA